MEWWSGVSGSFSDVLGSFWHGLCEDLGCLLGGRSWALLGGSWGRVGSSWGGVSEEIIYFCGIVAPAWFIGAGASLKAPIDKILKL